MCLLYCMYYYRLLYNFISILYALLSHFSDISAVIRLLYQCNFCSNCSISMFLRRTLSCRCWRYDTELQTRQLRYSYKFQVEVNCSAAQLVSLTSQSQCSLLSPAACPVPSVVFGVLQQLLLFLIIGGSLRFLLTFEYSIYCTRSLGIVKSINLLILSLSN